MSTGLHSCSLLIHSVNPDGAPGMDTQGCLPALLTLQKHSNVEEGVCPLGLGNGASRSWMKEVSGCELAGRRKGSQKREPCVLVV